jgi:hypothetical protein
MPAAYFLSPFCPPVWDGETSVHIEPREYAKALERDWNANVRARNLSSDEFVLSWNIDENTQLELSGWLQPGKKVVSMDGTAESMAAFAIWHKNAVSEDEPLYLFDEGLHIKFEINDRTQAADIVEAIEKS